ncbi:prephenate dehydratase [Streptomyces sp. NBC_01351]|uniref:prephenate dehydratase domain-containing protein n=1 Tax=Streptomyces sp. NBC_01351 TaxID=2903833 RepID=UPI002E3386EF|nr:prephenate dehydratase domain-containing protein [Streptomyces sp. NBC_01351]
MPASSADALGARDRPRFAYLGPEGTFTEQALRALPEAEGTRLLAVNSADEALEHLRGGAADAAMLPVHNTVGGLVAGTVRALVAAPALEILREVTLSIDFALLTRPGLPLREVRAVTGHPHARAQAAGWLGTFLPSARWVSAPSNAAGAEWVRDGRCDAALAGHFTAARYGLDIAAERIQDHSGALTRFLLVALPRVWQKTPSTDSDVTSLTGLVDGQEIQLRARFAQLTQHASLDGASLAILGNQNVRHGIFIDCPGNLTDPGTARAIDLLQSMIPGLRMLGSYPTSPPALPGHRQKVSTAPPLKMIQRNDAMNTHVTAAS